MNTRNHIKSTTPQNGMLSWLRGLPAFLMLLFACATLMPAGFSLASPLEAQPVTSSQMLDARATGPAGNKKEVVFVESNVADYQVLLQGIDSNAEVHVLDASSDGLAQMAQTLAGRNGLNAIHIVSHGSVGAVHLGAVNLNAQNLSEHADDLASIGRALKSDGDILLYGCNVAAEKTGTSFLHALAQATRANVAASSNGTGSAALGGDWLLERSIGKVKTASLSSAEYSHLLASGTISFSMAPGSATATDGSGGSADIPSIVIQITGDLGQPWTYETPYLGLIRKLC